MESISFHCTSAYERLFSFCCWGGIPSTPPFCYKLFRYNGKGSPRQQHSKAIFRWRWCGGVAKKRQASGQTCGWWSPAYCHCTWREMLWLSIWKWRRRIRRTSAWSRPGLRKHLRTAHSRHTENWPRLGRLVNVSTYMPTKSGSWLDWLGSRELDWRGSQSWLSSQVR